MSYQQTASGIYLPASKKPELREVATTRDGRDITRGYVDPFLIQQPTDSVLRVRGSGDYAIYKEVLRDDHVAATFAQRRLSVIGCEWQVEAGGAKRDDQRAADHLRAQLGAMAFDRITDQMLYGIYYGYSAAEVLWGRDGNSIAIEDIRVRDRVRFGFDGFGQLRLKTQAAPQGELLPARKFWSFCTGADHHDEPYGLGLAHWLYWPVFFKRAGVQFWLTFLERFGQPTVIGKHPTSATDNERRKLLDCLEAIATDTGITVPQGMEIAFLEAARSGTADYTRLVEQMDSAITKIVLLQTASTQGTPGRLGGDDLQGDVNTDRIRADADLVCESFNRTIARWLTEYNYPNAALPRVYRVTDPEEDLALRAERDTKIFGMGFSPTLEYIREQYGEGWEVRQAPAAIAADPTKAVKDSPKEAVKEAAFADAATEPTLDLFIKELQQRAGAITTQWIDQVRTLVTSAESFEALLDGLLALDMPLDDMANALSAALRAATLAGQADAQKEAQ